MSKPTTLEEMKDYISELEEAISSLQYQLEEDQLRNILPDKLLHLVDINDDFVEIDDYRIPKDTAITFWWEGEEKWVRRGAYYPAYYTSDKEFQELLTLFETSESNVIWGENINHDDETDIYVKPRIEVEGYSNPMEFIKAIREANKNTDPDSLLSKLEKATHIEYNYNWYEISFYREDYLDSEEDS